MKKQYFINVNLRNIYIYICIDCEFILSPLGRMHSPLPRNAAARKDYLSIHLPTPSQERDIPERKRGSNC